VRHVELVQGLPAVRVIRDGIRVIDRFLTPAECSLALDELECAVWRPSLVYVKHDDGIYRDIMSPLRVSETAQQRWFSDPLQRMLKGAERRLEKLFCIDASHLESWQATTYPHRGTFYYHLDAGYWEGHHAGDRILTFLLYLTTPLKGGGTHFRALDVHVEAKAGRLLVWDNLFGNGACNYGMIHSSVPLLKGKKTTLITWQRQRRYRPWQTSKDTRASSRKSRSATARSSI
jgi:prolyl 4-hydroxylase